MRTNSNCDLSTPHHSRIDFARRLHADETLGASEPEVFRGTDGVDVDRFLHECDCASSSRNLLGRPQSVGGQCDYVTFLSSFANEGTDGIVR